MNEGMKNASTDKELRMASKGIKIIFNADDAVVITQNENNWQRQLYVFNTAAKDVYLTHKKLTFYFQRTSKV